MVDQSIFQGCSVLIGWEKTMNIKLLRPIAALVLTTLILMTILVVTRNNDDAAIQDISHTIDLMKTMPFYDSEIGGATPYYLSIHSIWPDMSARQKIEYHLYIEGIYNYSSSSGNYLSIEPIPSNLLHFSSGLINVYSNAHFREWTDLKGNHSFYRKSNSQIRNDLDYDFERKEEIVSESYYPGYFEIYESNAFDNSGFDDIVEIELVVSNSIAAEWYHGVDTGSTGMKQLVQIRFIIHIKLLTKTLFDWSQVSKFHQTFGGDIYDDSEVTYPIWLTPYDG